MEINKAVQVIPKTATYIRLSTMHPLERLEEWRKLKPFGYRVLDKDGITVYHELEAIRQMVLAFFQEMDADIFLFGSQARGEAGKYSDYDIGYDTDGKISSSGLSLLKESLEELPIPAQVDLLDFKEVPEKFAEIAIKGGVVIWKQKLRNSRFILNV